MSAEVRFEQVAYCADCVDGINWDETDDVEEWAEQHNREHHPEETS